MLRWAESLCVLTVMLARRPAMHRPVGQSRTQPYTGRSPVPCRSGVVDRSRWFAHDQKQPQLAGMAVSSVIHAKCLLSTQTLRIWLICIFAATIDFGVLPSQGHPVYI